MSTGEPPEPEPSPHPDSGQPAEEVTATEAPGSWFARFGKLLLYALCFLQLGIIIGLATLLLRPQHGPESTEEGVKAAEQPVVTKRRAEAVAPKGPPEVREIDALSRGDELFRA